MTITYLEKTILNYFKKLSTYVKYTFYKNIFKTIKMKYSKIT